MTTNIKYPYLIAEVGGNHAGNFKFAKQAIVNAKKAGADCVKYQWYSAEKIVHPKMKVMKHVRQKSKEKTQLERFKNLELSKDQIKQLFLLSKQNKIDFCVTPFNIEYVSFLSQYVNFFKIASGDLDFIPLLEEINLQKKPVFLSTGLSTDKKIKNALNILNKCKVTILHCISSYPTPIEEANLSNIINLKKKFKCDVGLSDHTTSNISSIVAVGMGAKVIEKHFLPNKNIKNVGDYELSLNPKNFKVLRNQINEAYLSLGNSRKNIYKAETNFNKTLKRSIYFSRFIKSGSKLNKDDIIFLRPFDKKGINVDDYSKLLNKKLKKDVKKLQLVKKIHF